MNPKIIIQLIIGVIVLVAWERSCRKTNPTSLLRPTNTMQIVSDNVYWFGEFVGSYIAIFTDIVTFLKEYVFGEDVQLLGTRVLEVTTALFRGLSDAMMEYYQITYKFIDNDVKVFVLFSVTIIIWVGLMLLLIGAGARKPTTQRKP